MGFPVHVDTSSCYLSALWWSRSNRFHCSIFKPAVLKSYQWCCGGLQTSPVRVWTWHVAGSFVIPFGMILQMDKASIQKDPSPLTRFVLFCFLWFPDMCLASSEGSDELQSRSKLLRLLDTVTDALVWAIAKTGLTFRQQYTRLAHLLMLLSHIRHVRWGIRHLRCTAVVFVQALALINISWYSFFFHCAATRAWIISTAWKWRTWCLCMTCCWRCWMPTSCTAPGYPAGLRSRSPRSSRMFLPSTRIPLAPPPIAARPEVMPRSHPVTSWLWNAFTLPKSWSEEEVKKKKKIDCDEMFWNSVIWMQKLMIFFAQQFHIFQKC